MSKRFRRQDAAFYKRLGTKWRKPKGHQSKQRVSKNGSGLMPRIGYGSKERMQMPVIRSEKDLENLKGAALVASGIGALKMLSISEAAEKKGIKILNMKKIKRAEKIARLIQKNRENKEKEKKKEETGKSGTDTGKKVTVQNASVPEKKTV